MAKKRTGAGVEFLLTPNGGSETKIACIKRINTPGITRGTVTFDPCLDEPQIEKRSANAFEVGEAEIELFWDEEDDANHGLLEDVAKGATEADREVVMVVRFSQMSPVRRLTFTGFITNLSDVSYEIATDATRTATIQPISAVVESTEP